ncbi:MAG: hypothetical protein GEU75_15865 [Dehalococcoidia bacterium]|nr:hypothetical protein [Dehalococcoidia bacterium]
MSLRLLEEEEYLGKIYDATIARRLGGYLRPYVRILAVASILVISIAVLKAVGPLIIKEAVDSQIKEGTDERLATLVLTYLGVLIVVFLLSFVQIIIMTYVGQRVMMTCDSRSSAISRRCPSPSSTAIPLAGWSPA